MLRQPALRVDRRLAAHPGRCDRLAVHVVGAVARDVDARHFGPHLGSGRGDKVAVRIDVERRRERRGIRDVPDRDEDALHGKHRLLARLHAEDLEAADGTLLHPHDLHRDGVPHHLDLLMGRGALRHDL